MFGKKKHKVLSWSVISLIFLSGCNSESTQTNDPSKGNIQVIKGETQGTTYGVQIVNGPTEIQKKSIDSLLHAFDMSLSGYIPESNLSQFNQVEEGFIVPESDQFFLPCLEVSIKVYKMTDGAFDPSVTPLMRLWGFMKDQDHIPTVKQIDSTLNFVGFEYGKLWLSEVKNNSTTIQKLDPRVEFGFNAIAQGYSVDVVAEYLRKRGCTDFYIEIGGEIYVTGKNPDGENWRLGVDKPVLSNSGSMQRVISAVISLSDKGVATSGNYRKFYEKDGKIYAHTLSPKSGRPAENELLSTTVIASNTTEADGLATAFMVMGLENTKAFLENHKEYEALLIYSGEGNELNSFATPGLESMLEM